MSEKILKHLVAGGVGLVALIAYVLTMAPTVSFWDCGEFVACANTLGIPHPPGTPFFVFFARAVIVALPMVEEIAKRVNYISVFTSAATVYLVALFAWDVLAMLFVRQGREIPFRKFIQGAAAAAAGLLLAFSDTFWFNAVEAEVYGLAMFMLVLVSYLGLLWVDQRNNIKGDRLLILICYVAFLGVGVHLYSLLTIPAVFLLLLVADESNWKRNVMSAVVVVLLAALVMVLFGAMDGALPMRKLFVLALIGFMLFDPKGTRLPRWPLWFSGFVLYSVVYNVSNFLPWSLLLVVVLLIALKYAASDAVKRDVKLSLWFVLVALIGYSTHLYIPIRSELNPTIDENNPEINIRDEQGNLQLGNLFDANNWKAFNDFVERKQYGSESMLSRAFYRRGQLDNQVMTFPNMGFGGYQIAQYLPFKVGAVSYYQPGVYALDPDENVAQERGSVQFPTQMMVMGENEFAQLVWFLLFNGLVAWILWAAYKRSKSTGIYLGALYVICSAGLIFYINFSDGTRMENREGQSWLENMERERSALAERGVRIPAAPDPNELLKTQLQIALNPKSRNVYENTGVWKTWLQIQAGYQSAGLQARMPDPVHLEVRERDYFYTPAFIFMSLVYGVGLGVLLLGMADKGRGALVRPVGGVIVLLCGVVPLFANYKEHNRSNLWVPWDYAFNLLESCEKNAILFTNGDNDTFPLWFAQEVAGVRKDVRVVNLSLGNTDWYIKQMLEVPPILKLSYDKASIDADMVLSEENASNPTHYMETWLNKAGAAIPTLQRQLEILGGRLAVATTAADSAKVREEVSRRALLLQAYTALQEWGTPRKNSYMKTQDKLVMDLVMNNPDRPIHFSTTVGTSNFVGLEKYMVQKGMIFDLMKGDLTDRKDELDVARTAYLADSVFKYRGLGDGTAYVNRETEQLLFNYNSIYIRLAIEARGRMVNAKMIGQAAAPADSTQPAVLPVSAAETQKKMDEALAQGLHFLEKGMYQFPSEWRNYVMAADLCDVAGQRAKALEYLEKGVAKVKGAPREEVVRRLEALKAKPAS